MAKKVLKTMAAVSALTAMIASCSQNPTQVVSMHQSQNDVVADVAMKANSIAISEGAAPHAICTDGYVYKKESGVWNKYTSSTGYGGSKVVVGAGNEPFILKGGTVYWHCAYNLTDPWYAIPGTGTASDIACQVGSYPEIIWRIKGNTPNKGAVQRWESANNDWVTFGNGSFVKLSVDASGIPYVLNSQAKVIYKWSGTQGWKPLTNCYQIYEISVGRNQGNYVGWNWAESHYDVWYFSLNNGSGGTYPCCDQGRDFVTWGARKVATDASGFAWVTAYQFVFNYSGSWHLQ